MTKERWVFGLIIAALLIVFVGREWVLLTKRVARVENAVVQILNARQGQPPIAARPILPLQKAPEEMRK